MCGQGCVDWSEVLVRLAKSLIVSGEQELRDEAARRLVHLSARQRFLPQLVPFLNPDEVHGLLSQEESLGLSEQTRTLARDWLARTP